MLKNMKKKKTLISRKKIIHYMIAILVIAYSMGGWICLASDAFPETLNLRIMQLIFLVLFPLMTFIMWLPLCVAGAQIYDMNDEELVILPPYKDREKWRMILHILCTDDVTPYLKKIAYRDIDHALFTADRHIGNWGMSRYSYLLKLYDDKGLIITVYINPMANGLFMPVGKGGIPLDGFKTRDEICNMMQFLIANGVKIDDPNHILDALKNHDVEVYDYLESLHIKRRY